MIEKIIYKKKLLAIIVKTKKIKTNGVNFISPTNLTLQVGFINRPMNHTIIPHTHKKTLRKINKTAEVLYIKDGVIRVDFYNNKKNQSQLTRFGFSDDTKTPTNRKRSIFSFDVDDFFSNSS